jgi:hypothetical protein
MGRGAAMRCDFSDSARLIQPTVAKAPVAKVTEFVTKVTVA